MQIAWKQQQNWSFPLLATNQLLFFLDSIVYLKMSRINFIAKTVPLRIYDNFIIFSIKTLRKCISWNIWMILNHSK